MFLEIDLVAFETQSKFADFRDLDPVARSGDRIGSIGNSISNRVHHD